MSKRKRATVAILNPRDGRKYTSLASAKEYVRRGAAMFVGGGLEFFSNTPRSAFLLRAVEASFDPYVDTGMASVEAIEGLPVVGDVIKLVVKPSGRKPPHSRCKPAKILFHAEAA